MIEPVIKTVTVPCPPGKAFDIFVNDIGKWWPLETHAISPSHDETAETVHIEGTVGGDVFEISISGLRHKWGKVTFFKPGEVFAMTWHLSNPPSLGTLITVTFIPIPGGGTEVFLRHDNWQALGDSGREKRNQYNHGWVSVLSLYTEACQD